MRSPVSLLRKVEVKGLVVELVLEGPLAERVLLVATFGSGGDECQTSWRWHVGFRDIERLGGKLQELVV